MRNSFTTINIVLMQSTRDDRASSRLTPRVLSIQFAHKPHAPKSPISPISTELPPHVLSVSTARTICFFSSDLMSWCVPYTLPFPFSFSCLRGHRFFPFFMALIWRFVAPIASFSHPTHSRQPCSHPTHPQSASSRTHRKYRSRASFRGPLLCTTGVHHSHMAAR